MYDFRGRVRQGRRKQRGVPLNEEIRASRHDFERAYLVGVQFGRMPREEVEDHLRELESLVTTAGAEVAGSEVVRINRASPQYLVGTGKAEEIATRMEALDCDVLVFDDDLAPPQQHLWEEKTKKAVIDRRKVIIDIFAQRARTREARLQIELATLEYMLPRLKGAWTHLERQRGGLGQRGGAGELQIEVDRRIVRDRIARLRKDLVEVRHHRANQRKRRERVPIPTAAIVGYTNSGKSSLLNAMTEAGVLAEDKLFATLDATTRRIDLPNNQKLLLSDTVGFIRKLPTTLIDAFKSTLEEAAAAEYLVHVVDVSHPRAREQYDVTTTVLKELGADDKPTVLVLNKIDLLSGDRNPLQEFGGLAAHTVLSSVATGEGLRDVRDALGALLSDGLEDLHLCIPASRYDVVSAVHRDCEVLEERHEEDGVHIHARIPHRHVSAVAEFVSA